MSDSPGLDIHSYEMEVSVEYPVSFLEYLQWLEQSVPAELDPHHSQQHSAIYRYPGIRHYRLEDFDTVSLDLAQEYGLKLADVGQLGAGHYTAKSQMTATVALKVLARGTSLNASPRFPLPRVTPELLAGTEFEAVIQRIFREDIALYDSLPMRR